MIEHTEPPGESLQNGQVKDTQNTINPQLNSTLFTPETLLNHIADAIDKQPIASIVPECQYLRVGVDYFKIIYKRDRYGIIRQELKTWKKDEIKQDHGTGILNKLPKYDDFTMVPDNINFSPVVENCYNLYRQFCHQPIPGNWDHIEMLLRHIFQEQYPLGLRYLQILYLHPERKAPILALVSKERQTGKTTFLNWLYMIFGSNMAMITPEDLKNGFNNAYAHSNIIAIEETMFEKSFTIEKLKALSTGKFLSVNRKFVDHFTVPFFGKIILTSNNEEKFVRIDEEEIRFFVRKVGMPEYPNHNLETELIKEIPAFLYDLSLLPPVDFSTDRSGFTPAELDNDFLKGVKRESKSWLYKDLSMKLEDLFSNEQSNSAEVYADPASIKHAFFPYDNNVTLSFLRQVLKDEFNLSPSERPKYFKPLGSEPGRTGRVFTFVRSQFLPDEDNDLYNTQDL